MAATLISEEGALTAADLHLDGDDSHDDDESECTDRTDDDSFLANNSITKMMKNSLLMLDSLTDEMQKELARGDDEKKVSRTASSSGTTSQNVRVVTPSSITSTQKRNERPDDKRFKDMTISIELDNRKGQASHQSATLTPANESALTASSPFASPLISPIYASTIKNTVGAMKVPTMGDIPTPQSIGRRTHDHASHNDDDDGDDDLSLDDSLANEMNALKEVALELNRELQSADTVQKAIERIGNSRDPKVKSVLESDDKTVLRQMIHEEMRRQKSWTLTEDEMTQLLTAVAGAVWSVVLGLLIRAMTMEVMV